MKLIKKLKTQRKLKNLRSEVAKYVKEQFGNEYVEKVLHDYDSINEGMAIGDFIKTVAFLDLVETVKSKFLT